jgi:hypothetical protein
MTTALISADLLPDIYAECAVNSAQLPAVVQRVGNRIKITLLVSRTSVQTHLQHGDEHQADPPGEKHDDPVDPIAEPINVTAPFPTQPDNPLQEGPTDVPEPEGAPLQIGLPLHPTIPQPPGPGVSIPLLPPARSELRPLKVRVLHVDERRGHGHVAVGRTVRRVEIDGTLAQMRELRERVQLGNPELSVTGAFDLTSCVSQPVITLKADEILEQLAEAEELTVVR